MTARSRAVELITTRDFTFIKTVRGTRSNLFDRLAHADKVEGYTRRFPLLSPRLRTQLCLCAVAFHCYQRLSAYFRMSTSARSDAIPAPSRRIDRRSERFHSLSSLVLLSIHG